MRAHLNLDVRGACVRPKKWSQLIPCYFARGHLSPDAAFIEGAEQDATYFFFNAAPQFQSFNNVCFTQNNTIYNVHIFRSNFLNILQGNWVALEKATRVLAEE